MEERYIRNFDALTPAEFEKIRGSRVLVAGCGGLGGYLIELLARLGVGALTAVDGDVFEANNLNRQLLSAESLLGRSKARAAVERISYVNSSVKARAVSEFITADNAAALVDGHDLVLDALDNVPARRVLAAACARCGVPMVHGAVCGWNAQISTILPGDDTLERIYANGSDENKTILAFTPALCAAAQMSEAVRLLTGRPSLLSGKLLLADLRYLEWQIIQL